MGSTNIGTLAAVITLNSQQFSATAKSVASEASAMAGKVTGVLAALAVPVTAAGFFEWMKSGLNDIKEMDNQARKMGVDINELGGLMRLAGGDGEGFIKGIGKMRQMLGQASLGSEEAARHFKTLGFEVKDLKGLGTAEVFGRMADKLNQMSDATEAAAVARQVFGRGSQAMAFAIEKGSAGVDEAIKKNKAIAGVFSPQDVANTRAALRSLKDVDESITAIQRHLAVTSAPFIKMLTDAFVDLIPNSDAFNDALTVAARTGAGWAADFLEFIQDVRGGFKDLKADVDDVMYILKIAKRAGVITPLGGIPGMIDAFSGKAAGSGGAATVNPRIADLRRYEQTGGFTAAKISGGPNRSGEANLHGLEMTDKLIEKLELEAVQIRMTADEFERFKVRVTEDSATMSKSMQDMTDRIQKVQDKLAAGKLKEALVSPLERFQKEIRRVDDLYSKSMIGPEARGGGILKALESLEGANKLGPSKLPELAVAGSKEAFDAIRNSTDQNKDPLVRIAEAMAAAKASAAQRTEYLRKIAASPMYLRKSDLAKGD